MTGQLYLVEETGVPGDNHRLTPSCWQLSHMPQFLSMLKNLTTKHNKPFRNDNNDDNDNKYFKMVMMMMMIMIKLSFV